MAIGQTTTLSGTDVYGVDRELIIFGNGDWQTIVINWELQTSIVFASINSFTVDNFHLSCGNIINTCNDEE